MRHTSHGRWWIAALLIFMLVAAHVALFRALSGTLRMFALLAAILGVVIAKYTWWKRRR
jgi:hypothetical protein